MSFWLARVGQCIGVTVSATIATTAVGLTYQDALMQARSDADKAAAERNERDRKRARSNTYSVNKIITDEGLCTDYYRQMLKAACDLRSEVTHADVANLLRHADVMERKYIDDCVLARDIMEKI